MDDQEHFDPHIHIGNLRVKSQLNGAPKVMSNRSVNISKNFEESGNKTRPSFEVVVREKPNA